MNKMTHFEIRGVIEGFYGYFYTFPERIKLIEFLSKHRYNHYVYAPKNDRYHRDRWRDPYPPRTLANFAETIKICQALGISFCYAISPGQTICYQSWQDFDLLKDKLKLFFNMGVRSFSLLLDDIHTNFVHEVDAESHISFAHAHANLCNRVYGWLCKLHPACTLSMCPTDYCGSAPFGDYLHELGEKLHPAVNVMYTGPQVCSREIKVAHVRDFGEAVSRPPLLWDNYPVNDGEMAAEMHIGPIRGRDGGLSQFVRGILVNPMNQAEASRIALATYADYFEDPAEYDPQQSWEKALCEVAGKESTSSLQLFAQNSLHSCLDENDAALLKSLTEATVLAIQSGEKPSTCLEFEQLDSYLDQLGDASYHLVNEMGNLTLRAELIPWLELLDEWLCAGKIALDLLRANEKGTGNTENCKTLTRLKHVIEAHPKRLSSGALMPLIDLSLELCHAV
jgi:hyaluronoglucosaminidase